MLVSKNGLPSLGIEGRDHLGNCAFENVPTALRRRAYDVDYVQLRDVLGGQLWVTRHGWQHLETLDPASWYFDQQYTHRGTRLDGSGTVYRVPGKLESPEATDLVVKFCRFGQDIRLDCPSTFPGGVPRHVLDSATFNDPLREFGLLEELRGSIFDLHGPRILTKRPLAIFSPGKSVAAWQLGRSDAVFQRFRQQLRADQQRNAGLPSIDYSVDRQYVSIFEWVAGTDVQQLIKQGTLSTSQAAFLVEAAVSDLQRKGFRVLDMKPDHLIVRVRSDGTLARRQGGIAYVLVDFELLQRTPDYESWRERRDSTAHCSEPRVWACASSTARCC